MNMKFLKPLVGIACCIGLLAATPAFATGSPTVLNFYGITKLDATGAAVADGVANLRAEVIDISGIDGNKVRFKFTNNSNASSLTDVYFADGALLGISGITSSGYGVNTGVKFTQGAKPSNLPGGNNIFPAFQTTADFSADSDAPVTKYGVQNSDATDEWLAIDFWLKSGKSFADVISALTLPAGGDWLRIGLHVQGFPVGSTTVSESFINSAIPEPEVYTMLLAGLGLVGGIAALRRRKQGETV